MDSIAVSIGEDSTQKEYLLGDFYACFAHCLKHSSQIGASAI